MQLIDLLSVMDTIKSIGGVALAVLILLAMITIHEFGHFIAGRILGFKINEFAVGFGPAILKKRSKKSGVLYSLRVIPLGGYCAFDGEDELEEKKPQTEEAPFEEMNSQPVETENKGGMVASTDETEEEYPEPQGARFNDQAPWKRIIVLLAGATMNYLLALFLILTMFAFVGRPVYEVQKFDLVEGASQETVGMFEGGLQTGDTVLAINGKNMYLLTDWQNALDGKKKGDTVKVTVLREGKKEDLTITLYNDASFANMNDINDIFYSLGIAAKGMTTDENGETKLVKLYSGALMPTTAKGGFFETIGNSFAYSWKIGGTVLRSLGELLTGKLGIETMGGPVTTIKITSEAATSGWMNFLNIAALIGVNLAVFNLLPIPALDGCKVIFCIIEWIRKKPINRNVEAIIHFVGIVFLFGFAILVDLLQLF